MELWISDNSVTIISIRETVMSMTSWLANLYATMIPAKGEIQLSKEHHFTYDLAEYPHAALHVGWPLATGFLSQDILPRNNSCYQQGNGISFLMTSHLRSLQNKGTIPSDITFKTYSRAGPKPGNIFMLMNMKHKRNMDRLIT